MLILKKNNEHGIVSLRLGEKIMRMHMLPPIILCRQHLNGEHGEIHKFRPDFERRYRITGRVFPEVQIQPCKMKERHDLLAKEMIRRGGNHQSPYEMPFLSHIPLKELLRKPDLKNNLKVLLKCPECRKRYIQYKYHNSEGL